MAGPWFVRSSAGGTADGLSWANAKTTLAAAATASSAGDTIWVADDHAESQASGISITFPGAAASPSFVYCADHTQASPGTGDLKISATVTASSTNSITISGSAYVYGITFKPSNNLGLSNSAGNWQLYQSCGFDLSAGSGTITLGGAVDAVVEWINTTYKGNGGGGCYFRSLNCRFVWRDTPSALQGSAFPSALFSPVNGLGADLTFENLDLSGGGSFASGKTFWTNNSASAMTVRMRNCKLASTLPTISNTPSDRGNVITAVRCGNAAGAEVFGKWMYQGTESNEATIVKTGGSGDGTSSYSSKVVTTANSSWVSPFESLPIRAWVDKTTSTSVTVYGTTTGGGVPHDDDIWIEVVSLGDSGDPQGQRTTSTKANNLAASAAVNNSSDGSTWGGGGAGNGFKTVLSFTPAQKGPVDIIVKVAKASSTYYIDRNPTIS